MAPSLTGRPAEDPKNARPNLSESDRIDVAGPHFSASFEAIRDVLAKVKSEHLDKKHPLQGFLPKQLQMVNFVSPDASGDKFIGEFQGFCAKEKDLCRLRTLSPPSSEVARTL